VGVDDDGLPVGLQIIGDAWDEACVLQVLAHLERAGIATPAASRSGTRPVGLTATDALGRCQSAIEGM
jgi:aspartyl-tRNA(Asn)/glutamyl-tRNA(Gln) amidotransferase subunit A